MNATNLVLIQTWLNRKPSSWALLISILSTFLLVLGCVFYWQNFAGFADLMTASHHAIFRDHQWWRAWTTLFAHADEKHLLSNVFLFSILGYFLSGYFGVLLFPVIAFLFGGLTNLIVLHQAPDEMQLIGVSGVVFWMGGTWLALYFALERRRTILQRTLRAVGVGLLLFMPAEAFDPSISYKTHFVGFVLGVLFGFLYFLIRKSYFRSAEIYEALPDGASENQIGPFEDGLDASLRSNPSRE